MVIAAERKKWKVCWPTTASAAVFQPAGTTTRAQRPVLACGHGRCAAAGWGGRRAAFCNVMRRQIALLVPIVAVAFAGLSVRRQARSTVSQVYHKIETFVREAATLRATDWLRQANDACRLQGCALGKAVSHARSDP
jgi:hypothetical protein